MKKITILLIFAAIFVVKTQAQVTIGSGQTPDDNAILDIKDGHDSNKPLISKGGLLLPRVELTATTNASPLSAHVQGMLVYNTKANGTGVNAVYEGIYYNTGTEWLRMSSLFEATYPKWFFMPSIPVDVEAGSYTFDLFAEFKKQFGNIAASENSTASIMNLLTGGKTLPADFVDTNASYFEYYVVGYDTDVFENVSVSATGVLTYTVPATASPTDATFMNIVFVVK